MHLTFKKVLLEILMLVFTSVLMIGNLYLLGLGYIFLVFINSVVCIVGLISFSIIYDELK